MTKTVKSIQINDDYFFLEAFLDPLNKRIRIDDYHGNCERVIQMGEELAGEYQAEKVIFKVRFEHFVPFLAQGYQLEATVDGYFRGSDACFFAKYFTAERKKSDHWLAEDAILRRVCQLSPVKKQVSLSGDYMMQKVDESLASELAAHYGRVFQIYPTPLNDPEYVKQTIGKGTIYYVFHYQGEIVSAASAEINPLYRNAEITDCATLPEHRKAGLMKVLLTKLESELRVNGIYCAYSIARSLSFGMNAVLFQLGYGYRGRLMNNCYIYDKLEDMNMWVKNLASC